MWRAARAAAGNAPPELGAESDHESAGEALRAISYEHWISIEMRSAENNVARVGRAVRYAKAMYGNFIPAP